MIDLTNLVVNAELTFGILLLVLVIIVSIQMRYGMRQRKKK